VLQLICADLRVVIQSFLQAQKRDETSAQEDPLSNSLSAPKEVGCTG